ncbi:hypothetical protein A2V56_02165 [Candidatus Woesebacteria bacterium RBG_19FT_COMBO_42_9]|uniref:Cation-transporting P-type ATPase N-terminal domain-containing protein n=1 Tax=Candidatus Woesebacteria bacterium RBG_16_42_24 TaxID=1802485 RepID=A0A1F7XL20_9BACT|nr:MAG: hypothetical protein A2V97_02985 [Candidatus Woesebacteria bacterium RBG_16_42_24]OGM16935.1 MAG: hypothetical protein A2V56_02165 [Candidatus Woesebacteria bacterium RBG_19FT_COMBO_42_9]
MLPQQIGLTTAEAEKRLSKFGPNILPEKPPPSDISIFLSQLKNPLIYVLIFAGLATFFLKHFSDAVIIAMAVIINTILGFFQERRAGKALSALKSLVSPQAEVVRDGKRKKVGANEVVPGDIIVLSQGMKVPADGKLVFVNRMFINEAILTGESQPASKANNEKVYMGTVVSSGQGAMEVQVTGALTQIGKIAEGVQETSEDTPLKKQIGRFSKQLLVLVVFLTLFVFVIGLASGESLIEIFKTAVALAVSAIPEGLIVSLTVVLAIGMQRILRRNGLVRNLTSAETLGGATTICIDKTGTLTQGKMTVTDVIGDTVELAKQAILANDLDDPLVIAAFEWARGYIKDYIQEHPRLDSIPFSSKERFFASLNKWKKGENIIFVSGAPDSLLSWSEIKESEREKVMQKIEDLTKEGKRVIGFSRKVVPSSNKRLSKEDVKGGLNWVGLLSFSDPVRPGVREALSKANEAGIKIIVITGDYANTAEAVLTEIGMSISETEELLGEDIEKLNVAELAEAVKHIKLFARTTPEQKLKIVEALKKNGEVVAMMGDGVNDAPAINKADIGIVVGDASDVARESADLVLLDSNFATIVAAVEEGRGIFENIRKIILYLLSDAFGEIVTVTFAIIVSLPLPVTAVQILWINLVSDGFPSLALTVDPKRKGIMVDPPRPPKERVVTNWMKILIGIVSLVSGLLALAFFTYVLRSSGDVKLARSVAFLTLGINSLVYVFSVKSLTTPFWKGNIFDNKWLIAAVLAGFGLQAFPFIFPFSRQFFDVSSLPFSYWLVALGLSALMFIMVEVSKIIFRRAKK